MSDHPDARYLDAAIRRAGDLHKVFTEREPDWKSAKSLSREIIIEAGNSRHPILEETFA